MEINRGGRPPKTGSAARPVSERPRTLASYGITKDQSSKWQKLAAIPEADFEEILQAGRKVLSAFAPTGQTTGSVSRCASCW